MVKKQNFDMITKEFLEAARRDNLPEDIAANIVDMHRGPVSSTDAFVTWIRWYHALPGDPIANLTISDIHKMFQRGTEDWRRTEKALDEMFSYVTDPANIEQAVKFARLSNWQSLRTHIASALETKAKPSLLLSSLNTPIALAQKGLVRDLLVETIRRCSDANAAHASLLAEFERGGVARLAPALGALPPYGGGKGIGGAAGWAVAGTTVATIAAIACGTAGLAGAAMGCGIAAAGYAGYCLFEISSVSEWW